MKADQKRMHLEAVAHVVEQEPPVRTEPSRDGDSIWWSVLTGIGQVQPGSLEEDVLRELGALPKGRRNP